MATRTKDTEYQGSEGGWTDGLTPIDVYRVVETFETVDAEGKVVPRAGDIAEFLSTEIFTQISATQIELRVKARSEGAREHRFNHFKNILDTMAERAKITLRAVVPQREAAE